MARIGSLFVNLALQDATFVAGLKRAEQKAFDFGELVTSAARAAGIGLAAVGAAAALLSTRMIAPIGRAVDRMDDLSKSAQKVGMSVGELSQLRWGAALSDVTDEKLNTGLTKLNVALASLAGKASPAGEALKALGVSAGTSTSNAVKVLAERFAAMPDGVQKSALAVKIFGKSGAEMIPMLNSGAEGLAEAAQEASNLGLVIDTETAKAAEAFNDNLTRLRAVQGGIITQITAGMVPAFAAVTNEVAGSLKVGDLWQGVGRGIANVMLTVAEGAYMAASGFLGLAGAIIDYGVAVKQAATLDIAGARETMQAGWFGREADFNRGMTRFARIRADIANFKPGDTATTGVIDPDIVTDTETTKTAKSPKAKNPFDLEAARGEQFAEVARRLTAEADVYAGSISTIKFDMDEIANSAAKAGEVLEKRFAAAQEFARGISTNLAQAIVYGQSIGAALVNSFKAAAAEALANGLFDLLLGKKGEGGGLFGGIVSGIGSFLSGKRADGGPVSAGHAYLVGERGPEVIIPRGAGNVISNAALRGAGGRQIVFDLRGAVTTAELLAQMQAMAAQGAITAIGVGRSDMAASRRPRLPRGLGA